METVLNKNYNINEKEKVLESKISEYENNHKNGSGKYFTLDEVNELLDKAIKIGRQVA